MNGKKLSELLAEVKTLEVKGNADVAVTGVVIDSRQVKEGHLFVAVRGSRVDGHEFDFVREGLRVLVRQQSHVRQVVLRRAVLAAGVFKVIYGSLQLRQIIKPLLAAFCAEHFLVAALVQDLRQEVGDRVPGCRGSRGALDEPEELRGAGAAEQLGLVVLLQCLVERAAVLLGKVFKEITAKRQAYPLAIVAATYS